MVAGADTSAGILEFTNDVQEDALMIERKIAEIVRESSEIITDTHLEVIAEVAVNGSLSRGVGRYYPRRPCGKICFFSNRSQC